MNKINPFRFRAMGMARVFMTFALKLSKAHASWLVCLLWFGAIAINASDRYASLDGTNDSTGGFVTWTGAATNIQWAVNVAWANETVWVSNGTYLVTNTITVRSNITICGWSSNKPVLDGNNSTQCFNIAAANVTLSNFFITRGTNKNYGGGVNMQYGSVIDCIFSNNACGTYGGGLYIKDSGTVQRCTFMNNSGRYGGGLCINGTVRVDHCSFQTNTATGYGSGAGLQCWSCNNTVITGCDFICNAGGPGIVIYYGDGVSNIISHCTIVSNCNYLEMSYGGGGLCQYSSSGLGNGWLITNCVFSNNISYYGGGGITLRGGTVKNCIIVDNVSTTGNSGSYAGGGGISMQNYSNNLVQDCIIERNRASYRGGGIDITAGTIRNCLIRNNVAGGNANPLGGGIYYIRPAAGDTGAIISCSSIVSNYSTYSGGGIASSYDYISANFENCIIYFNKCGADGTGTSSNYYFSTTTTAAFFEQ